MHPMILWAAFSWLKSLDRRKPSSGSCGGEFSSNNLSVSTKPVLFPTLGLDYQFAVIFQQLRNSERIPKQSIRSLLSSGRGRDDEEVESDTEKK
ncbi:unnamed protein product [Notodromas monacha]|uniref:Uncharacterized protein n=1 Tax=Notodromas monacha TaxID=399045 RepID=A0A7R9GCN0_9CRUS|nr:unnamed protein product [Notodromas monacha]CAG0916274.1 unnamed protein product [Notodromas monacha]